MHFSEKDLGKRAHSEKLEEEVVACLHTCTIEQLKVDEAKGSTGGHGRRSNVGGSKLAKPQRSVSDAPAGFAEAQVMPKSRRCSTSFSLLPRHPIHGLSDRAGSSLRRLFRCTRHDDAPEFQLFACPEGQRQPLVHRRPDPSSGESSRLISCRSAEPRLRTDPARKPLRQASMIYSLLVLLLPMLYWNFDDFQDRT